MISLVVFLAYLLVANAYPQDLSWIPLPVDQGIASDCSGLAASWSLYEKFVWARTCNGDIANLSEEFEKGNLESRKRISLEFLETILFQKPFRDKVTRHGVRIRGAYFDKHIDLSEGDLPWRLELAQSHFKDGLNMSGLQAERQVSLSGSVVEGKLDLYAASIGGSLDMSGIQALGTTDMSLISVGKHLFMQGVDDSRTVLKGINMQGADIGGHFDMSNVTTEGVLNLSFTSIGSDLFMQEADFFNVNLERVKVGGRLDMRKSHVLGVLEMGSISIGSSLFMGDEAKFADVALHSATIGLNLIIEEGEFKKLNLQETVIDRELRLVDDTKSVSWSDLGKKSKDIQFNLRNTKVGIVTSIFQSWPARIELDGFTYRQLDGWSGQDELVNWLELDGSFSPQPYQQLATVLRNAGESGLADEVLYASKDKERKTKTNWLSYLRLSAFQYLLGYGLDSYMFQAFLLTALGFNVLGWICLKFSGEHQKFTETLGESIGMWFCLDRFLPVIQLDPRFSDLKLSPVVKVAIFGTCIPIYVRGYFYFHQIAGYILMIFVIGSLTRMVQ